MRYYLPILFVELYLCVTLLVFQFGPVSYRIDDPVLFWGFISLYHISMVLGYIVACETRSPAIKVEQFRIKFTGWKVWLLIFASVLASLIGHKNITNSESLIPYTLVDEVINGILRPEEQYIKKMEIVLAAAYAGDKLTNILYFFIAPAKILIIPVLIFYWARMGILMRVAALFASVLPVLSGFSTGTNKPVFDFAIFYGSSLAVYFVLNYFRLGTFGFAKRKFFVIVALFALLGAVAFFGKSMMGRGGDASYIETISPLGDIKITSEYDLDSGVGGFLMYTYIWLSNYIVQGYYGFSLALTQDFTSTLGVGNSQFLMRQFEWITGVDLSGQTYQHKIDAWWGETTQWHSFYSYIANDYHFVGVAFWCLVLGFFLAKLWVSILDNDNLYAKLMIPLFAVLVVFIPANNQVFGYLETFSAFFVLTALWLYSVLKVRRPVRMKPPAVIDASNV
ncbi:hypothetical protein D3C77_122970 [compost metagenome]